jgi:hypothetical protein
MGITHLNRAALSDITLAQVDAESKSTTWSICEAMEEGDIGCLPNKRKYRVYCNKEACLDILSYGMWHRATLTPRKTTKNPQFVPMEELIPMILAGDNQLVYLCHKLNLNL